MRADAEIGLAVLADGMGGYNAGEVASGIAVAMLTHGNEAGAAGRSRISRQRPTATGGNADRANNSAKANAAIYQAAQSQPQYAGMGTTLVVALFTTTAWRSATSAIRGFTACAARNFEQVTRDHSLLQEQIDSGMITKEQARYSQNKNLVTRAVGIDPEVETEMHTYDVEPGDIYLLCSDGLSDMVTDEDIQATLTSLRANLPLAAAATGAAGERLRRARQYFGYSGAGARRISRPPTGWFAKLKAWFR